MDPVIRLEQVRHVYNADSDAPVTALDGVDLAVRPGEYLVILGHNGSGKSTLAKHLNGLLTPTAGDVWVKEWNTRETACLREIRSTVGMVFQTPDNQIVATIVEEDVAFGPENLGVPHDEIVARVDWSLEQVEMSALRKRAPHMLSGGQKQRICIAGMLAMQPDVLVLDEATAMLDPLGRKEVLSIVQRLNREQGTTIVAITHFMEEAVDADRLIIMAEGRIVMQGTPRELFAQPERLRDLQLGVPQATRLAHALHERDSAFPQAILTADEFVQAYAAYVDNQPLSAPPPAVPQADAAAEGREPIIELVNVSHNYMHDTPLEVTAIEHVNLVVRPGETLGIIGHTGSGKSTIVQHFNALLSPHVGTVTVFGHDTERRDAPIREIRRRVGLVFQQPETQLFERYVGDDIAYGPRNLKLSREEIRERVRRAMTAVGLGFEEYKDRVTFALSGGQKRRVALAGVLALEPDVLVLDEPTSGLDPAGRRRLLALIDALRDQGITLVVISHNMEELAEICDRLYVIAGGTTILDGTVGEIFSRQAQLNELGLDVPGVTRVLALLAERGLLTPDQAAAYTVDAAAELLGSAIDAKL
ncbi:MAG: energy-coupling factor transporter ATPase [Caldilineaceae bacterium]|nr:energy-coupling factor transporter ATPase [Caldilineaceae bacterium]